MGQFKIIDTTADLGIECSGENINDLFNTALLGLYYSLFEKHINFEKLHKLKICKEDLKNDELTFLLYDLLDDALFYVYSKNILFNIDKLSTSEQFIIKNLYENRYKIKNEIKAITMHNLNCSWDNNKNLWIAKVILDI
ncbi:MAG: archease [Deferribacterota bacterium]|nr:archease [Deferribacterota bacterium]